MRHFPDGDSVDSLRKLKAAATWINESYSEKFYSSEVKELFSILKKYDFEYLKLITSVLMEMRWLDTMQPCNLTLALRRLKNCNKETFTTIISWMKESGVLATCNDVESFLNVISSIQTCGPEDLRNLIEQGVVPENVIEVLIRVLGETHPVTQNLIELAIGYDNQRNPNSPFAVYCEMRKKSSDEVEHRQLQLTTGLSLRLNSIKEPRPAISIHMPSNVWKRLFEQFEKIDPSTYTELLGDISLETILKLKNHHDIVRLLDPKDSLKVNKKISSHSHMLREVLKKAQEDFRLDHENIGSFVQLLVNITTCQTGKLNGITHSYIYMNQGRALDESVLGAEGFKQEIVSFFKEELRRFREATLAAIVRNITRRPQADPHDLYYVRGIIGHETGLFFENETPTVDIYAWGVSGKLRGKTKQQLLDLFYQYYKVEDVVDRVHSMLNNGSISISNEYLRDEAMDETLSAWDPELVVLDGQQKPLGLTPKAAQRLLEILGFVVNENKPEETMKT
ncbi:MAG: hypothetical protein K2Y18_02665 [Alphaproteobacteria bacterium]|nr:hypothetical protein [Alphaproteobacteria bacterium]